MNLNEKMQELIDKLEDGNDEKLIKNKFLINEIADFCKQSILYERGKVKGLEFAKDKTALELYQHLLIKVANAPTHLHMMGTTIMIMPLIAEKLDAGQDGKTESQI